VSGAFELSGRARKDLFDILDYIADDNPAAALRIGEEIYEACSRLAERPGIGHLRDDVTGKPFRFWSVRGRYTIVYHEGFEPLTIVRIFGPGQDMTSALN